MRVESVLVLSTVEHYQFVWAQYALEHLELLAADAFMISAKRSRYTREIGALPWHRGDRDNEPDIHVASFRARMMPENSDCASPGVKRPQNEICRHGGRKDERLPTRRTCLAAPLRQARAHPSLTSFCMHRMS